MFIKSMTWKRFHRSLAIASYRLGHILAAWFSLMCILVRPLSKGSDWMNIELKPDDLQEFVENEISDGVEMT